MIDRGNHCRFRTTKERCLKLIEPRCVGLGDNLDPPIGQIPGPADDAELAGDMAHENPEAHTLHSPADQVPPGHAALPRLLRANSTTIGRSETPMMPMTTRLKLSRTTGRLPKKYPALTNSPTQARLPMTLLTRKRP